MSEYFGLSEYFEGRYFKHQIGNESIALISGRCEDSAFIQVIAKNQSHYFGYPLSEYKKTDDTICVGSNVFSVGGIRLNIDREQAKIAADVRYGPLSPIRSDIMGPFRFFPMQCRHGILSMRHNLAGSIRIDDRTVDFTGGVGYIEEDSGRSFPSEYLWIQCGEGDCSMMLSVAEIPFLGRRFQGCVCVIQASGKEYRLATYRGVKILRCDPQGVILQQGKYRLEVEISMSDAQPLSAPQNGRMSRRVKECVSCYACFTFFERNRVLHRLRSDSASAECMCSQGMHSAKNTKE